MTIVGVNIVKISAEKNINSTADKVGINNNITVKEVAEKDFSLGNAKQKGLRFRFEFNCKYTPDIGGIDLEGDVLFLGNEEQAKNITKEWKEKKRLPADMMEPVLNSALNKCNIEALKISQDINLPSPIPMPRIEHGKAAPKASAK
ncbi:hypothetical protein HY497_00595 [Candidatus Woesearchaeota archaeon]|nr:hypothetical protein [Candidatus Woesearchaeota archaeon]